jgi:hypothetical protein
MAASIALREAGSRPVFWFGLAIILVLAIAGHFLFRVNLSVLNSRNEVIAS